MIMEKTRVGAPALWASNGKDDRTSGKAAGTEGVRNGLWCSNKPGFRSTDVVDELGSARGNFKLHHEILGARTGADCQLRVFFGENGRSEKKKFVGTTFIEETNGAWADNRKSPPSSR